MQLPIRKPITTKKAAWLSRQLEDLLFMLITPLRCSKPICFLQPLPRSIAYWIEELIIYLNAFRESTNRLFVFIQTTPEALPFSPSLTDKSSSSHL
jgi:hypothetical protein